MTNPVDLLPEDAEPVGFKAFIELVAEQVALSFRQGGTTELFEWDDVLFEIDHNFDAGEAPDPSEWPDRVQASMNGRLVWWLNERYEIRRIPFGPDSSGSGPSTVGWRLFAAHNQTAWNARSNSLPAWEIQNYRSGTGSRETIASITKTGKAFFADGFEHGDWEPLSLVSGVSGAVTQTGNIPTPQGGVSLDRPPQVRRLGDGRIESRGWFVTDGSSIASGSPLGTVPVGWRPDVPFATITRQVSSGVTLIVWPDGTVATSSTLGSGAEGHPILFDGFIWEPAS